MGTPTGSTSSTSRSTSTHSSSRRRPKLSTNGTCPASRGYSWSTAMASCGTASKAPRPSMSSSRRSRHWPERSRSHSPRAQRRSSASCPDSSGTDERDRLLSLGAACLNLARCAPASGGSFPDSGRLLQRSRRRRAGLGLSGSGRLQRGSHACDDAGPHAPAHGARRSGDDHIPRRGLVSDRSKRHGLTGQLPSRFRRSTIASRTSSQYTPGVSQALQSLKCCLNPKVLIALAAAGVAVVLLAPNLIAGALPLLLALVCPLSMLVMMGGMARMGTKKENAQTVVTSAEAPVPGLAV